jgi:hypothetical protein
MLLGKPSLGFGVENEAESIASRRRAGATGVARVLL